MADKDTPLIVADPKKGVKVDSGVVAKQFRDEIKEKVAKLIANGEGEYGRVCWSRQNGLDSLSPRCFSCFMSDVVISVYQILQTPRCSLVCWPTRILPPNNTPNGPARLAEAMV